MSTWITKKQCSNTKAKEKEKEYQKEKEKGSIIHHTAMETSTTRIEQFLYMLAYALRYRNLPSAVAISDVPLYWKPWHFNAFAIAMQSYTNCIRLRDATSVYPCTGITKLTTSALAMLFLQNEGEFWVLE